MKDWSSWIHDPSTHEEWALRVCYYTALGAFGVKK